jgi:hypothetical protein
MTVVPVERTSTATLSETDAAIEAWSTEKVDEFLATNDLAKEDLGRIARIRFGMSRGAISSAKSKEALRQKLRILLSNERGHAAIARLARTKPASSVD